MIDFVQGKVIEGDIKHHSFRCKCLSCKSIGVYGPDNVCSWAVEPLNKDKFRLYKTDELVVFCSNCTMPMVIGPNLEYSEPIFYDFDTTYHPLKDIESIIDIHNLDFTWNDYYENNHSFSDLDYDLMLFLTGKTESGRKIIVSKNGKNG